jgi:carbon monoxide dehydrogenase subunit G
MKREDEKNKREESEKIGKALKDPDHYAECYPGMSEMNDAIDDSDEEVDYTKMDIVRIIFKINLTLKNIFKQKKYFLILKKKIKSAFPLHSSNIPRSAHSCDFRLVRFILHFF